MPDQPGRRIEIARAVTNSMRICLDIQAWIAQRAGVGRYTRMLAEHLGRLCTEDELRLFYFDFQRRGVLFPAPNAVHQPIRWCPGRLVQKAWKTLDWPPFEWFAGPADIYHFPNFILPPLRSGRAVVTVHDASFARLPQFAEERNLKYLTARIRDTLERADAVITDSAFGAVELRELFSVPADRLFPIYPGIAPEMTRPPPETVARLRSELSLDRPYLLTVGTIEPRKNLVFLVEIFERLASFQGLLVVAGMPGWRFEPILERMRASARARDIRYVRYVTDEQLPALYAGAEAFLFPSLYEGFGFPPLEAMACGTPVVSSAGGSLGEVLGDAAVIVRGSDAGRWAEEVARVLSTPTLRKDLEARGLRHASKYPWEETARRTLDVYRKAAG